MSLPSIDQLLEARDSCLAGLDEKIDELRREIDQRQEAIKQLAEMRRKAAEGCDTLIESRALIEELEASRSVQAAEEGLGPKDAVLDYLKNRRAKEPEIVDALECSIKTKAEDRRRVISQTLVYLRGKGEVTRDGEGFYSLPNGKPAAKNDLKDKVGWEVADVVMGEKRKPMRPSEIVAIAMPRGFGKGQSRKKLADNVRTGMRKHPEKFQPLGDGRWEKTANKKRAS